MDFYRSSKFDK